MPVHFLHYHCETFAILWILWEEACIHFRVWKRKCYITVMTHWSLWYSGMLHSIKTAITRCPTQSSHLSWKSFPLMQGWSLVVSCEGVEFPRLCALAVCTNTLCDIPEDQGPELHHDKCRKSCKTAPCFNQVCVLQLRYSFCTMSGVIYITQSRTVSKQYSRSFNFLAWCSIKTWRWCIWRQSSALRKHIKWN